MFYLKYDPAHIIAIKIAMYCKRQIYNNGFYNV